MKHPFRRPVLSMPLCAVICLAGMGDALAANVEFTATVDRASVPLNGELTYTLTIAGDAQAIPQPKPPPMTEFAIVSTGRNQSFNFVNGRTSSSVQFNYRLTPRRKGTFTIGPASITIDGDEYKTDPITVQVTNPQASPRSRSRTPRGNRRSGDSGDGDVRVFVELAVDNDTVHVNEAVTLTVRVLIGQQLLSNAEYAPPGLQGFWSERLTPQKKYSTVIDGLRYDVHEIITAVFPTAAGTKTIDPAKVTVTVPDRPRQRMKDPFGMFNDSWFGVFDRGRKLRIESNPVTLTVLPLPNEGKPAEFRGAVGDFQIGAAADHTEVNVGDPVTVTVTISGTGQIRSLAAPVFTAPEGVRHFSAGSKERQTTKNYRVGGMKTFDEVFIPQRPGLYTLPSFTFSYFDPRRDEYRSLRTDPIPISVTGQAADMTIPALQLDRDELADLAADVRFLKTDGADLKLRGSGGVSNFVFVVSHVIALLGFGAIVGLRRHRDKMENDPVFARRCRAARTALSLLDGEGAEPIEGMVADALERYFGDRFNLPTIGQTPEQMHAAMTQAGIDALLIEEFLAILSTCGRLRFMPGDEQAERSLIDRARDIITRLEKTTA